jgi:predicted TIM-barrel fold metal-dependent hydrolase
VKYVIDYMGSDNIVYSTDYPHVDARFPESADTFLEMPISDEAKRKILWDNCATLYGLAVAVKG